MLFDLLNISVSIWMDIKIFNNLEYTIQIGSEFTIVSLTTCIVFSEYDFYSS